MIRYRFRHFEAWGKLLGAQKHLCSRGMLPSSIRIHLATYPTLATGVDNALLLYCLNSLEYYGGFIA
jgi:hypothetical protein